MAIALWLLLLGKIQVVDTFNIQLTQQRKNIIQALVSVLNADSKFCAAGVDVRLGLVGA